VIEANTERGRYFANYPKIMGHLLAQINTDNKPNKMIEHLKNHIREIIGLQSFVIAVYIFGSRAIGSMKKGSDLDIAFLMDEVEYCKDPFLAISPVYMSAAQIGEEFDIQTDVTILNASSIEMAFEILTTGRCIFETNIDRRLEYEAKIRGMYYDFKPFLEELRSKSLNRL